MTFFRTPDLAVDLGTARIRVAGGFDGICERPASLMTEAAMRHGVVINADAAVRILHPMIRERKRLGARGMRVLACAPTDVSALERNLVRSCLLEAGAKAVVVVPEPLAAAVGSGVDIGSPYSKLIVDFGEGVTDCAVIRDGQIVESLAERTGCSDLREIIRTFAGLSAGIAISHEEADRALHFLGVSGTRQTTVKGTADGDKAASGTLRPADVHAELSPAVERMIQPIKTLLRNIGAGSGAEVIEDGIFLTGGGALLPGMREAVAAATGIETRVVEDPLRSVIRGARRMLPFAASLDLWRTWGTHQRTPHF
jgi:rod shape-determining protein MreB